MQHENFTSHYATAVKRLIIGNKSVNVLEIAPHTVVENRLCSEIPKYFVLT
jgi:hypothetical protein